MSFSDVPVSICLFNGRALKSRRSNSDGDRSLTKQSFASGGMRDVSRQIVKASAQISCPNSPADKPNCDRQNGAERGDRILIIPKLMIGFVAVLVGLAAIGALFGDPGFDFEEATPAERQVWLDSEAETMAIDVRKGIFATGVKQTQMDLQDVIVDQDQKLVDIVIVAKGSLRTYRPKDFRMQFLAKTCPGYARTPFGKIDYRTRLKIVRENGDIAVAENLSNGACEQYRAFMKRRSNA